MSLREDIEKLCTILGVGSEKVEVLHYEGPNKRYKRVNDGVYSKRLSSFDDITDTIPINYRVKEALIEVNGSHVGIDDKNVWYMTGKELTEEQKTQIEKELARHVVSFDDLEHRDYREEMLKEASSLS